MSSSTSCYECKNRREIPGDCHSQCVKPDASMIGNKHGIKNGWFMYPFNYDPIWMESDCKNFESNNSHLKAPFLWSHAINQSAQQIFSELERADPNWIKEIFQTAKEDGAEPNTEVIGVFQNLLTELVIQNDALLNSISEILMSGNESFRNCDS